jgi:hypothetical protein
MRLIYRLSVGAVLAVVTACGSDGSQTPDAAGPSSTVPAVQGSFAYALVNDSAWTMTVAVDPPTGDPSVAEEAPPVEWYAEYRRASPDGAGGELDLRLSGHTATLAEARVEYEAQQFVFSETVVNGVAGLVSQPAVAGGNPAIVLLDADDLTIKMASTTLSPDDLVRVAAVVEGVNDVGWRRAGGSIL